MNRVRQYVERGLVAEHAGERGHLHHPARAVVVAALALVDAVVARRQPGEVLAEPLLDGRGVGWREAAARREDLDRGRHLDEVNRVDDAHAAAGHRAQDGLAVEQARVHARAGSTNQARRCLAAASAYFRSPVSLNAAPSAPTPRARRTITRRCRAETCRGSTSRRGSRTAGRRASPGPATSSRPGRSSRAMPPALCSARNAVTVRGGSPTNASAAFSTRARSSAATSTRAAWRD